MAKFPIPENCSAYVPMNLKEFCSKINGLVMKVTISLKKFFITNPLILEQNSFKFCGSYLQTL
jgi:hypothetical protein